MGEPQSDRDFAGINVAASASLLIAATVSMSLSIADVQIEQIMLVPMNRQPPC